MDALFGLELKGADSADQYSLYPVHSLPEGHFPLMIHHPTLQ